MLSTLKQFRRHLFRRTRTVRFLKRAFAHRHGKTLDLHQPQTFTEKMYCRMVQLARHDNPLFTQLADKYLVRDYIAQKIGPEYLIPLIWHGTNPAAIPFDTLPTRCIIKTNHGCGRHIVVNGPIDRTAVIDHLTQQLKQNFFWVHREPHYFNIPPCILIEGFIEDGTPHGPQDHRFWCFNGQPQLVHISNHLHREAAGGLHQFYDKNWQTLDLTYLDDKTHFKHIDLPKPKNFDAMWALATQLAQGFDFVRIDLYNVNGKIYFGEYTLTPMAGLMRFTPPEWDLALGKQWEMA